MIFADRKRIVELAKGLSDEELEAEYYEAVFDSLGSCVDLMYDRCYDIADIEEQVKYESYLVAKLRILEEICLERGIKLWE